MGRMTPRAKRLTPKQKVLRKWSKAFCWKRNAPGYIVSNGAIVIGYTLTGNAVAAWADAAKRLRAGRGKS